MIEWNPGGRTSKDGEWEIQKDRSSYEPTWSFFSKVPEAVSTYRDQHPGDTDAWIGIYTEDVEEMHAQAERLLKIASKRRSKAST